MCGRLNKVLLKTLAYGKIKLFHILLIDFYAAAELQARELHKTLRICIEKLYKTVMLIP